LKIAASPEVFNEAISDRDGLTSWWTRDTESTGELGSDPGRRFEWRCLGGHHEWVGTERYFDLDWARYPASLKPYVETGEGEPRPG